MASRRGRSKWRNIHLDAVFGRVGLQDHDRAHGEHGATEVVGTHAELERRGPSPQVTMLDVIIQNPAGSVIGRTTLNALPTADATVSFPFGQVTIDHQKTTATHTPAASSTTSSSLSIQVPPGSSSQYVLSSPPPTPNPSPASSPTTDSSHSLSTSSRQTQHNSSPTTAPPTIPTLTAFNSSSVSSTHTSTTASFAASLSSALSSLNTTESASSTSFSSSQSLSSNTFSTHTVSSSTHASATSTSSSSSILRSSTSSPASSSASSSASSFFTSESSAAASTTAFVASATDNGVVGGGAPTSTQPAPAASTTAASGGAAPVNVPVVGGVVGALAGFAFILILVLFLLRWRKRKMAGARELPSSADAEGGRTDTGLSGGQMSQRPTSAWGAAGLAPIFRKMRPYSQATTASEVPPSERGFQKISGRKLESVLRTGGDGYGGPSAGPSAPHDRNMSGSSFYRDSQGTYGGPASAGTSLAVGPASNRQSGAPSSNYEARNSLPPELPDRALSASPPEGSSLSSSPPGIITMQPGPARQPVVQPGFGGHGRPGHTPPGLSPVPPHLRQDGIGRSHASQDGSRDSRGSRFAEDFT